MFSNLRFSILILTIFTVGSVKGGNPDIVTVITSDSVITVSQPEALAERLKYVAAEAKEDESGTHSESTEETSAPSQERIVGYRVQVFSDNNLRTAKGEARSKAAAVGATLPQYKTYVTYEAPFWRLRVGDFRSKADATEAADEIKRAFPHYSREIRVVRDRVNL